MLTLLAVGALAQDDITLDLIDLDDIDLDGSSSKQEDGASQTGLTYTGGLNERSGALDENPRVAITHAGYTSVRCIDVPEIRARVDYTVEGTNRDKMKAAGDGIGLSVWGEGGSGGVKVRTPYAGSGITDLQVPLVVSVPKQVRLTVSGGTGGVEIINCEGTVKATAKAEGVYAKGSFTSFDLQAYGGDVIFEQADGAQIDASSKLYSSQGAVQAKLPVDASLKLYAKGEEVAVWHTVSGDVTATSASGEIGGGGSTLTVQAKGKVDISTP